MWTGVTHTCTESGGAGQLGFRVGGTGVLCCGPEAFLFRVLLCGVMIMVVPGGAVAAQGGLWKVRPAGGVYLAHVSSTNPVLCFFTGPLPRDRHHHPQHTTYRV